MPKYRVQVERVIRTTAVVDVVAVDGDQAISDVESRVDDIAVTDNPTDTIRVVRADPIENDA